MILISIFTNSWGGVPNIIGIIPSFVVAMLVTRICTIPLKKVTAGINGKAELSKEIIGCVGTLRFNLKAGEIGQVTVDNGAFLVNCIGEEGVNLPAGATVKIIGKHKEDNVYSIEPFRGELE